MDKKQQQNKKSPVSEAKQNGEKFHIWVQAQLEKEDREIDESLEEIPDTGAWTPTEEKFQALMQTAKDNGFRFTSEDENTENSEDFDNRIKGKKRKRKNTPVGKPSAGWWRKKAIRWTALAAATMFGIFGVTMTSQANRAYIMQEVHKIFGNDVNTKLNNDEVTESDRTEEYARQDIEEQLNIKMPRFFYVPEEMQYDSYYVDTEAYTAYMQYKYKDQLVYFMIFSNIQNASGGLQKDVGEKLYDIDNLYDSSIKVQVWNIADEEDSQIMYALQWNYQNVYYELFGKIPEEEICRIAEKIMY